MKRKWVTADTMPKQGKSEKSLWALQKRSRLHPFSCQSFLYFVNWWNAVSTIQLCVHCSFNYPSVAVGAPPETVKTRRGGKEVKKLQFIICVILANAGLSVSIIHIILWCNHRQYKWKLPPALSHHSLSWQIWAEIKHKIVCWVSQAFPRVLRLCNHRCNESITVSKLTSRQLHQPTIKYLKWVQIVRGKVRETIYWKRCIIGG